MTACRCEGHDHDTDQDVCVACREVVADWAAHICHDMAWERFTRHMQAHLNAVIDRMIAIAGHQEDQ